MSEDVEVLTWPDKRLSAFDLRDGAAYGDLFVCEMWEGQVDDVRGVVPCEWHAALFRALIAQAGGVETKAVRRSHGTIVPAGAVPLPGDKIIPALLLPMEGSE